MHRPIKSFNRKTRLFQRSHSLVLGLPIYLATHDRNSSFYNPTAHLWNNLPAVVFPAVPDVSIFKSNVHKHYSPSSLHFSHNLFWSPPCPHVWRTSAEWLVIEKQKNVYNHLRTFSIQLSAYGPPFSIYVSISLMLSLSFKGPFFSFLCAQSPANIIYKIISTGVNWLMFFL